MLSALFPHRDWSAVRYVGFDMDGTLYDEFTFIKQAYDSVLDACADRLTDKESARAFMEFRWLEKGSSYNRIFDETHVRFGKDDDAGEREAFIRDALQAFRNVVPQLSLSARAAFWLHYFAQSCQVFLVTDGGSALQRRKAKALDLARYIPEDRMVFTSELGNGMEKRRLTLSNFPLSLDPDNVVFFGDREQDRIFSQNLGFHFVRVHDMTATG